MRLGGHLRPKLLPNCFRQLFQCSQGRLVTASGNEQPLNSVAYPALAEPDSVLSLVRLLVKLGTFTPAILWSDYGLRGVSGHDSTGVEISRQHILSFKIICPIENVAQHNNFTCGNPSILKRALQLPPTSICIEVDKKR